MSLCPINGAQCSCQPEEGIWCEFSKDIALYQRNEVEYIKKLESQIPKWIHVIDNPPKENVEVLFGVFDSITHVFQGYMRNGYIFSDSFEYTFLPIRGIYWQVLPGLPENIYKDLEEK